MNLYKYINLYINFIFLQEKFTPHILHKTAVFFNPRQKSMKALSRKDQREVLDYVSDELDKLPLHLQQPNQPAKRPRLQKSKYDDDDDDVDHVTAADEISTYREMMVSPPTNMLIYVTTNLTPIYLQFKNY